jgi:hypothetical protein
MSGWLKVEPALRTGGHDRLVGGLMALFLERFARACRVGRADLAG